MHQLMEVERIIRDVTKRNNVPVDLQIALLKFQSVEGTAGTAIIVRGTATAGSTVYLDVGQSQPVVIQNVNADGRWEAPVQPNKKLQERRGFIYGMVLKGSTKLFIRINIFNPTKCEPIPLSDLPRESVLRPLAK
jgi:hypothetical protein